MSLVGHGESQTCDKMEKSHVLSPPVPGGAVPVHGHCLDRLMQPRLQQVWPGYSILHNARAGQEIMEEEQKPNFLATTIQAN